jgi:hypothetical protein
MTPTGASQQQVVARDDRVVIMAASPVRHEHGQRDAAVPPNARTAV